MIFQKSYNNQSHVIATSKSKHNSHFEKQNHRKWSQGKQKRPNQVTPTHYYSTEFQRNKKIFRFPVNRKRKQH